MLIEYKRTIIAGTRLLGRHVSKILKNLPFFRMEHRKIGLAGFGSLKNSLLTEMVKSPDHTSIGDFYHKSIILGWSRSKGVNGVIYV
jgi:hypothetical protein